VFREVRRVLRKDGTVWCNLGVSFRPGKQMAGIPWRVAFALQADGWYLRSDIIWSKPNPMPESVTDRPTKAHEYVFLLTRSSRYYFDADAVREDYSPDDRKKRVHDHRVDGGHENYEGMTNGRERWAHSGRNIRSVWEIVAEPYPDAHFATFPQALVNPCILAGTSERGCCSECGAPWERDTARVDKGWDGSRYGERAVEATGGALSGGTSRSTLGSSGGTLTGDRETIGWHSTCTRCYLGVSDEFGEGGTEYAQPVPCTVLDPFLGSGTTALVARKHGRRSIGIELSPDYAALAARRLQQLSLLAEPA
jgi:DNA modification methylase